MRGVVKRPPRVALLLTGNELMSGDTLDSNSSRIAHALATINISVYKKVTVGDDREVLASSLGALIKESDAVIINGGLGPTDDDMTSMIVADACNGSLSEHPEAMLHLEDWCAQRRLELSDANLKQGLLPSGAEVIPNPIGSAVGFRIKHREIFIFATPGVPVELEAMLPEIVNQLRKHLGGGSTLIRRIQTFGIGESTIQQKIHDQSNIWPQGVTLGFRSGLPLLEIKLRVDNPKMEDQIPIAVDILHRLIGDHIIGEDNDNLALALQQSLAMNDLTITTAESCTGGLIASLITREAGASRIFETGFVTYSNESKQRELGVSTDLIDKYGAVSEPVVRAMLQGALQRTFANVGVAVSGIAGPSGSSASKPVGTVWIAWGTDKHQASLCLRVPGDRVRFQILVSAISLDLVRRQSMGIQKLPSYVSRFR